MSSCFQYYFELFLTPDNRACHIAPDGTRTNEDLPLPPKTSSSNTTTDFLSTSLEALTVSDAAEKAPSLCSDSGESSGDSERNGPYTPKAPGSLKGEEDGDVKGKAAETVDVELVREGVTA